jgi:hypothetical protein
MTKDLSTWQADRLQIMIKRYSFDSKGGNESSRATHHRKAIEAYPYRMLLSPELCFFRRKTPWWVRINNLPVDT